MMELITLVVVVVVVVFSGDHAWMVYYNTIMHSNLSLFLFLFFQDLSLASALSASFWLRSKFYLGEDGIK